MSIISKLKSKRWRYFLSQSRVTVESGGELKVGRNVSITKSVIYVAKGSKVTIGEGTKLRNCTIYTKGEGNKIDIGANNSVEGVTFDSYMGSFSIGDYNIISRAADGYPPLFRVHGGGLTIGSYNKICCTLWVRFGGELSIGNRNAINQRTEIRADHRVCIGSYNQISYDCVVWDTNTHCIYSAQCRREITDEQYPAFGLEVERPKTAPVTIGDDCWIARGVSILKGVKISDKCIVAYKTTIIKGEYAPNSVIMNDCAVKVTTNNI